MFMFFSTNKATSPIEIHMALIGIISSCIIVFYLASKLFRALRIFLISRLFPSDLTSYGKWAVVTGGSSGIGKSYAHQLASRGINVIIISNELEALKLTADEIKSKHNVQCSYIYADFTDSIAVYERVAKELRQKDIGILLNGAGIAGDLPCYFLEETEKNALAMISLHITTVVYMTLEVLPLMLAKNKGLIVNISSASSLRPLATWNVYSSCKAFSNFYTRALSWEYKNFNVTFQSLTPFFISSRMSENVPDLPKFGGIVPSCDAFAFSAIHTLGMTDYTCGYWIHELMWFFLKFVPKQLVDMNCLKLFAKCNVKKQ